ncbi:MAG: trypsin-like peptidase domain-containing protein [Pseudomonadota bacterium]
MRMLARALALAATALVPLAAQAQDSRLERLTTRADVMGFEAVGRIDLPAGDGAFCSGALIAPDLVLTAAHCLIHPRTGEPMPPAEMTFRAGFRDGAAIAERSGLRAVVHPDYAGDDPDGLRQLRTDVGLLVLAEPIQSSDAAPFALAPAPGTGGEVSVVSYARERSEAPAWQRACGVSVQGQGVLLMTCDTHFGSSGAPVFETTSGRPRIVSLISRGAKDGADTLVWGMEIEPVVAEVKAALRANRGVWPEAEGATARRLGIAEGGLAQNDAGTSGLNTSGLNRGGALNGGGALNRGGASGALFVRP